jgi:uncharacterized protein YyaL (SSP411 family)
MNNNKLILHAIIMKKEFYKTANQALNKAIEMFPEEKIKGFVRETEESWRVRVRPKTQFEKTSYVSKIINPFITLVFGKLLDPVSNPPSSTTHYVDFNKIQKYKKLSPK